MFKSPGHIAFSVFSLDIHWYGIIMSLSILFWLLVIFIINRRFFKEITTDTICDISFYLIISGLVSARLYYVLLDWSYYSKNILEIPAVWNGGISIQGAIVGGIVAGYYYAKSNKLDFFMYADLFSFGLIIGQVIGRWGNFFNSEAFGLPCSMPWKLYIPYASRPVEYKGYEFFHPTFLYESILNLFVFVVLFFVLIKFPNRKNGLIFFLYIILYSVVRIFVESIRIDSVLNINGVHIAHITSILFIIFALLGILYINKKSDNL